MSGGVLGYEERHGGNKGVERDGGVPGSFQAAEPT